jgi:hypothetical protein
MKPQSISTIAFAAAAAGMALTFPALAATPAGKTHAHVAVITAATTVANPTKVHTTKAALRDLWIGHVFWTRNVVTAALAGDAAAKQTAEKQVVANAQAIAAAIEPFYGAAAKKQMFTLLAGHYGAVKAYLEASIAESEKRQSDATSKLVENAGEIATFLSRANPHLVKATLDELLQAHGGHHISQVQQLQAKDYAGEAQTWAQMSQHMYVLADALGDALAKQFPAKF